MSWLNDFYQQNNKISGHQNKDGSFTWYNDEDNIPFELRKNQRHEVLGRDAQGRKILGELKGMGIEERKPLPLYKKPNIQAEDSNQNLMSKKTYTDIKNNAKRFREWNKAVKESKGRGVYYGNYQTGLWNGKGEKVL
mgnify:CR=1 FL=1